MAKVQRIWEQSGISVNDIDKTFKNFEPWNNQVRDMKDKVTSYYIQFNNIKNDRYNSILLSGKSGCGKTHLSLALANNLLKNKEVEVVYMPYRDVITSLKQNMTDEDYYKRTLTKYQKAEVLLIDDLLKGNITKSDVNIMFELINYRYLNCLPMIISTECDQQRLLDFDEAIGSRIYEMCKGYVVEIRGEGNNYRLR
jgi:DNA replication protein DnaC